VFVRLFGSGQVAVLGAHDGELADGVEMHSTTVSDPPSPHQLNAKHDHE
jgi:hypothetical protein